MSKVARRGLVGLPAVLILMMAVLVMVNLPAAVAQTQQPPRSHAQGSLALAANTTIREGVHAKLPPHISTLLGVSKEAEWPVMQRVVHTGNLVQGFDVSDTNKNDIVLFVVDETASDQNLYLTSPEGTLRKLVSVKAGVGEVVRISEKDKIAFKKERQFWIDRLARSGMAK